MKGINYFVAILIMFVLTACIRQKKVQKSVNFNTRCSHCDSLLAKGYFIDYPLRGIDKSTEGTPLIKNAENIKKDSFHVLTEFEVQDVRDNLFCFLGIKESMVDKHFHTSFSRNEWDTDNVNYKSKSYNYNFGNYVNRASSIYETVEKENANTEFWLQGGGAFRLEYTKVNGEFVYTGTMQDSINLQNCLEKEKK